MTRSGVFLAAGIAAIVPFVVSYSPPVGLTNAELPQWVEGVPLLSTLVRTVGIVTWPPSSTGELLTVYGHWIGFSLLFLLWTLRQSGVPGYWRHRVMWLIVAGFVWLALAIAWAPALVWLGVPASLAVLTAVQSRSRSIRIISLLLAAGFFLALIPEFLFVQDAFGNRMNTVFKLGYQAWTLLALGSACGLILVASRASSKVIWLPIAGCFLLAGATFTYAPLSVHDWIAMGPPSATLDGEAFIERREAGEARAIEWVRNHATAEDILAEAPGCGYGSVNGVPMSRFSAFTGVPAVIGWDNHERQWRRSPDGEIVRIVAARQEAANAWLDGQEGNIASSIEPSMLIFGVQERQGAPNCPLAPERPADHLQTLLSTGWSVAFESNQVAVLLRGGDSRLAASDN